MKITRHIIKKVASQRHVKTSDSLNATVRLVAPVTDPTAAVIAVLPAVTPTAVPVFVSLFEGVVARKTGTYSTVSRWLKIKNSNYTQSERRHELFESCKAKPPRRQLPSVPRKPPERAVPLARRKKHGTTN